MLDAEQGWEGDERVSEDRQQVTNVFLVRQHVHDESEQREEKVVGQLKPEHDFQIQPDLEVLIARYRLRKDPRHRQECDEQRDHEAESEELPRKGDQSRSRHRIGDLAESSVAFPPD